MAHFHSPRIITDGLILALDAANEKSFRGEPTVNLAGTESARTMILHDSGASVSLQDAPERGIGWKKVIITARGSNFRVTRFPYITHPTNTTRTYSLEVDFGTTVGYFLRGDGFTGFGTAQSSNGLIAFTFTTTTNSGSLAVFLNHNTTAISGINDVIYYRYYQVEDKPYATPFVNGTRGTTVATGGGWADRSGNGNNGELVNGPTYNSSNLGSLVFDGVDDYIQLSNSVGYTTNVSAFSWFKSNGAPVGGYHIIYGGQELEISIPTDGQLRVGVTTNARFVSNHGSGITDGNWHYVGFTFDGSIKTAYIDGVSNGIQSVTGTLTSNFSNRRIGRFGSSSVYWLNGEISFTQIFSKALTNEEVLQNYNATKGRFGL